MTPEDMEGYTQTPSRPRPIQTWYSGVYFRSALEADWAATLSSVGVAWSYEPEPYELPSGDRYRPDFFLPGQRIWFEVKGPHDERIHKVRELDACLEPELGRWADPFVVVGRSPERGEATMTAPSGGIVHLIPCSGCGHWSFMAEDYSWLCRICKAQLHLWYFPPRVRFVRVPRGPSREIAGERT